MDLFFCNNPSLIEQVKVLPGIGDHDAVFVEGNISPIVNKQIPRKIYLWKRADWDGLRAFMESFNNTQAEQELESKDDEASVRDVESLLESFVQTINSGIENFILSKVAKRKNHLPWVNSELKKLMRKRDKYFKIKNKTHKYRDIQHHKSLRREVQRRIRQAYWTYVDNMFSDGNGEDLPVLGKRFWSFIKHSHTDKRGIPSLKCGNSVLTDSKDKAELLNSHFKSIYSESSPMKLK